LVPDRRGPQTAVFSDPQGLGAQVAERRRPVISSVVAIPAPDPICVQLGASIAHEQPAGVGLFDLAQVEIGEENLLPGTGAREDPAVRRADERLTAEMQPLFFADPVAESGEVAILKCGYAHLCLEQIIGPFVDCAR
jgi:hypothetical protein